MFTRSVCSDACHIPDFHNIAPCHYRPLVCVLTVHFCPPELVCVVQSEDEVTQINRHILALLYRTLRFKMQHDDSLRVSHLAPLLCAAMFWITTEIQRGTKMHNICSCGWSMCVVYCQGVLLAHPLSPAAQSLVEGALGDMHGSLTESTHPDNANTLSNNSISIGGMSLSIQGLSTRGNRCGRPSWLASSHVQHGLTS